MYYPLSFCSSVSVRVPVHLNDHASTVAKKERYRLWELALLQTCTGAKSEKHQ